MMSWGLKRYKYRDYNDSYIYKLAIHFRSNLCHNTPRIGIYFNGTVPKEKN